MREGTARIILGLQASSSRAAKIAKHLDDLKSAIYAANTTVGSGSTSGAQREAIIAAAAATLEGWNPGRVTVASVHRAQQTTALMRDVDVSYLGLLEIAFGVAYIAASTGKGDRGLTDADIRMLVEAERECCDAEDNKLLEREIFSSICSYLHECLSSPASGNAGR